MVCFFCPQSWRHDLRWRDESFQKHLLRIVVVCLTSFSLACTPRRPSFPVGEVPSLPSTTREDYEYGYQVLTELSRTFPLSRNRSDLMQTRRVVSRLAQETGGRSDAWRVTLFSDETIKNAAATRGNFLFLWSGMLRMVRNDDELAAVLAHEMAHVLAQHVMPNPAEQISGVLASVGGAATAGVLAGTGSATSGAAQLGGALIEQGIRSFIVNPESRRKELEADQIGLFLMADAGFDPTAAVSFWERAEGNPEFSAGPLEFLSTHPSSAKRSANLRALLPTIYERNAGKNRFGGERRYSLKPATQEKPNDFQPTDLYRRGTGPRSTPPSRLPSRGIIISRSARIYSADDSWSTVRDVVNRDEEVTIECQVGHFFRITRPTPGYIDIRALGRPMQMPRC